MQANTQADTQADPVSEYARRWHETEAHDRSWFVWRVGPDNRMEYAPGAYSTEAQAQDAAVRMQAAGQAAMEF